MKRQTITVITAVFLVVSLAHAASQLSKEDAAMIEATGVIIYPGSVYLDGNPDFDVKFATADAPEKVQKWFQEKMHGWTVNTEMGMWVLHSGKPVTNPLEIMERSRVLVGVNENIPIVWGLKENMKTEIVVSISAQ